AEALVGDVEALAGEIDSLFEHVETLIHRVETLIHRVETLIDGVELLLELLFCFARFVADVLQNLDRDVVAGHDCLRTVARNAKVVPRSGPRFRWPRVRATGRLATGCPRSGRAK